MTATTIINKIKKENACSIHRAELLTNALHREGRLPKEQIIRFRPLFGDFDIINADFVENGFKKELCIKPFAVENIFSVLAILADFQ